MFFGFYDVREQPVLPVGWFTLALINAGLAQGKNRSGILWFLLSICLGPIATFLLVVFFGKIHDSDMLRPPTG